jgi:hypothetical protein
MRHISLFLVTLLLSGCGFIMGKRIDFGSDFANSNNAEIQALAGKTFYITNEDDFERLVFLKKELRTLSNSPTPMTATRLDCMRSILQVTDQYHSGIGGFIFTGKINFFSETNGKSTSANTVTTNKDTNSYSAEKEGARKDANWWNDYWSKNGHALLVLLAVVCLFWILDYFGIINKKK